MAGSGSEVVGEVGGAGPDDARVFPMEKLTAIVGGERGQLCHALIQLVMADTAYVEIPKQSTVEPSTSMF